MGDLKIKNYSLAEQAENIGEPAPGKTLYIKKDTPNINYKGILDQVLQCVSIKDVISKIKAGTQYVVQIPMEFQKGFNSGEYFMMQNKKTGIMWPSLMEAADTGRNQIVSPLPIAEQSFIQGNPLQEISVNYHNTLMQQQISQLTERVEEVYKIVERIEHGQMDEKIGCLEAGKNGLFLALSMPEGSERTMQINSSRDNLLVAHAQIGQVLKRRISEFKPLPKSKAKRLLIETIHHGYLDKKDRDVEEIQDYYDLYLKATNLIAASYVMGNDSKTAEQIFIIGEQLLNGINFEKIKSIEYSHPGLKDMFYDTPVEYITTEKRICLENAKNYDYIAIEVNGELLLEALKDGRQ